MIKGLEREDGRQEEGGELANLVEMLVVHADHKLRDQTRDKGKLEMALAHQPKGNGVVPPEEEWAGVHLANNKVDLEL